MSYTITIKNNENDKTYSFSEMDSCTWKTVDEVRYDGQVKHSLHITGNSMTDLYGYVYEEVEDNECQDEPICEEVSYADELHIQDCTEENPTFNEIQPV